MLTAAVVLIMAVCAASGSGPSCWGPCFAVILGGFCRFAQGPLRRFCWRYGLCVLLAACGCNVRANRLWHWLLHFRVGCNHAGLVAKRAGWRSTAADLWRTRSFVCSARACQGQWQSRPAGAYQGGRRSKDVTTWRWMGSVRLVVSLLPSAFRLLYVALRAK